MEYDVSACMAFPGPAPGCAARPRLNEEAKWRAVPVAALPDEDGLLSLIGAVLFERNGTRPGPHLDPDH